MAGFTGALTPGPTITGPYGVTFDRSIADALLEARVPDDVVEVEEAVAAKREFRVDEEFAATFDEFVRRTVAVSNRRLAKGGSGSQLLAFLRPPPFLWTFQDGTAYRRNEVIVQVRIYRISSFFDGETYTLFRRQLLRTVEIEDASELSRDEVERP
jgi:hypothetical protein